MSTVCVECGTVFNSVDEQRVHQEQACHKQTLKVGHPFGALLGAASMGWVQSEKTNFERTHVQNVYDDIASHFSVSSFYFIQIRSKAHFIFFACSYIAYSI